jgi:hypothetical protein
LGIRALPQVAAPGSIHGASGEPLDFQRLHQRKRGSSFGAFVWPLPASELTPSSAHHRRRWDGRPYRPGRRASRSSSRSRICCGRRCLLAGMGCLTRVASPAASCASHEAGAGPGPPAILAGRRPASSRRRASL